jgi:hypothetical protein
VFDKLRTKPSQIFKKPAQLEKDLKLIWDKSVIKKYGLYLNKKAFLPSFRVRKAFFYSFLGKKMKKIIIASGLILLTGLIYFICTQIVEATKGGSSQFLYENLCADCHGKEGEGLAGLYPPLANSDYIQKQKLNIACLIRHGAQDTMVVNGVSYLQPMPAFKKITEVEITNLVNYIGSHWGNALPTYKLEDIKNQLKTCKE